MTRRRTEAEQSGYCSPALESAHEIAGALLSSGIISSKTMRDFDVACLTSVESLDPDEIRAIRKQAAMSQTTFALVLNVTKDQVSKWERGEKHPSGPSLKLLTLARNKGVAVIL